MFKYVHFNKNQSYANRSYSIVSSKSFHYSKVISSISTIDVRPIQGDFKG